MDLRRSACIIIAAAAAASGCKLERATPRIDGENTQRSEAVALLGLRTAIYRVPDLAAAKAWYTTLLGAEPYFDEPFYVGFSIDGYELGLDPDTTAGRAGVGGGVAYWGVSNADSAIARALAIGAALHEPVQLVGGGVRIGSVRDPYGNVIGFVENPPFREAAR